MLTLFVTFFKPYNHFAPVFSVAVIVILFAGLTLIPSIFALMGRKAFWPFVPKIEQDRKQREGIWVKISRQVMKKPALFTGSLLVILLIGAFNFTSVNYSFNLLKSFPEDISSRQGFEILENHYSAGQLAPVTVILQSDEEIVVDDPFLQTMNEIKDRLEKQSGVSSVTTAIANHVNELPRNFLSESKKRYGFNSYWMNIRMNWRRSVRFKSFAIPRRRF
ncbi:MMPL family transporter [Bacillus sp. N9]